MRVPRSRGAIAVTVLVFGTGCGFTPEGPGPRVAPEQQTQHRGVPVRPAALTGAALAATRERSPIPTVPGATDIAPGYEHLCLIANGAVWCVGRNQYGQLGNGTTTDSTTLTATGLTDAVGLASAPLRTCAVRSDRTVWCWGFGASASGADSAVPSRIDGIASARQIAAGNAGVCAVTFAGAVTCWGTPALTGDRDGRPTPIALPALVSEVAVGPQHACALGSDGGVWCWGDNRHGQLGDGTVGDGAVGGIRPPSRVAGIADAAAIATGGVNGTSCAVLAARTVQCWGEDTDGQLGDGDATSTDRAAPGGVPGLVGAVSVSLGSYHGCATTIDGDAWCWGRSAYLGADASKRAPLSVSTPVRVNGITGAAAVRAQSTSSCVLFRNNTMRCWGSGGAP